MQQEFAKLNSKTTLKIEKVADGLPWLEDYDHWNYKAACRATEVCFTPQSYMAGRLHADCDTLSVGDLQEVAGLHARGRFHPCDSHVCDELGCQCPPVAHGSWR